MGEWKRSLILVTPAAFSREVRDNGRETLAGLICAGLRNVVIFIPCSQNWGTMSSMQQERVMHLAALTSSWGGRAAWL